MKSFRKRANRYFVGGNKFKKEVRRQLRLLITITFGFTIAFTWRQTIFDSVEHLVIVFTKIQGSTSLSVLTSLAITIVSLFFIALTSYLLRERSDY